MIATAIYIILQCIYKQHVFVYLFDRLINKLSVYWYALVFHMQQGQDQDILVYNQTICEEHSLEKQIVK